MIFQKEHIPLIIDKIKTQTRRLVNVGEFAEGFPITSLDMGRDTPIKRVLYRGKRPLRSEDDSNWITKWEVGKDYCVQDGRGKYGLSYCRLCGKPFEVNRFTIFNPVCKKCDERSKPLRFLIKSILGERLLDISEADVVKEGGKNKLDYLKVFYSLYKKKKELEQIDWLERDEVKIEKFNEKVWWNPEVWVLDFCLKEGSE